MGQRRADALGLVAESALAADFDRDAAGITINRNTATPDWYGEHLDLPWAIQALRPPPASVPAGHGVPAGTSLEMPPGPVLDAGPS